MCHRVDGGERRVRLVLAAQAIRSALRPILQTRVTGSQWDDDRRIISGLLTCCNRVRDGEILRVNKALTPRSTIVAIVGSRGRWCAIFEALATLGKFARSRSIPTSVKALVVPPAARSELDQPIGRSRGGRTAYRCAERSALPSVSVICPEAEMPISLLHLTFDAAPPSARSRRQVLSWRRFRANRQPWRSRIPEKGDRSHTSLQHVLTRPTSSSAASRPDFRARHVRSCSAARPLFISPSRVWRN